MDIPSILLILALAVPVVIFVFRPLFAHSATLVTETARRASTLLAERERVLAALQELDFDHALGKIPEDEYPARRAVLVSEGVAVLKALDELEPEERSPDAALEAAVARVRRSEADLETTLEAAVTAARKTPRARDTRPATKTGVPPDGYCPQCGRPVKPGDRFCALCGHSLSPTTEPA